MANHTDSNVPYALTIVGIVCRLALPLAQQLNSQAAANAQRWRDVKLLRGMVSEHATHRLIRR